MTNHSPSAPDLRPILAQNAPSTDIDNRPTSDRPPQILISLGACVTDGANWSTSYDKGGLVLFIPNEGVKMPARENRMQRLWPQVDRTIGHWYRWRRGKGGNVTTQVEREVKDGEKVEVFKMLLETRALSQAGRDIPPGLYLQ